MGKYGEKAVQYFYKGYNCSQSVVAAFAPELGIDEAMALKFASGFGGGVGRMREVCGAFCGLTAVIGLRYADPANPQDKSRIYAIVQQLAEEYKKENGGNSVICRELLGLAKPEHSSTAAPRTSAYYKKRPCPQLVALAADLAAAYMEEHSCITAEQSQ